MAQWASAILVSNSGWEKANGIYVAVSWQFNEATVYKSGQGFLLSREKHDCGIPTEPLCQGWVLGIGGQPLYVAKGVDAVPPELGWLAVPTWGREPSPTLRAASSAEAVVVDKVEEELVAAEALCQAQRWSPAAAAYQRGLDKLAHLPDVEAPKVMSLKATLLAKTARLPVLQAKALLLEGDKACTGGDWQHGQILYETAQNSLKDSEAAEAAELNSRLALLIRDCPSKKLSLAWEQAEIAVQSADWTCLGERLQKLISFLGETQQAGNEVPQGLGARVSELLEQRCLALAGEELRLGDENPQPDQSERHYAAALALCSKTPTTPCVSTLQAKISEAMVRLKRRYMGLALDAAADHLACGELAELDESLLEAQRALEACAGGADIGSLEAQLVELQREAAECKIGTLREMGEKAAKQGDWREADLCWAEAQQVLETASPEVRLAAAKTQKQLEMARCWVACTQAGETMQQADECKEQGNIFRADELYTEAIASLAGHGQGVMALKSTLHGRRAEVLQKKWQHKEAIADCDAVLATSNVPTQRHQAFLLASEASRALHQQALGEHRSHWLDLAVRYLEGAEKLAPDDHALKRRLRAWRRELPPKTKPVPMPPFDWSKVPKSEKANFFGNVERRPGFLDAELERIWGALKKETKTGAAAEPGISRETFFRVVKHLSGNIEEQEFQNLWSETGQDDNGLLNFEEFAKAMKFDDA